MAIVPNNVIIQSTVENFTGAKKVMAIAHLNIYRTVTAEEQALIRQVILESTYDISGIDPRSTDIAFRELETGRLTQVQGHILHFGDLETPLWKFVASCWMWPTKNSPTSSSSTASLLILKSLPFTLTLPSPSKSCPSPAVEFCLRENYSFRAGLGVIQPLGKS